MPRKMILTAALAVLFLLSACTAGQTDESGVAPAEAASQMETGAMDESEIANDASTEQQDVPAEMEADTGEAGPAMAAERPAWQTTTLTNARTGETFSLADFAGRAVYVEPMATWCTNCRRQLMNVRQAQAQLADEEVVFVALSVETNIGDGDLANYANDAGFDWLFAVASPELLQQLVDQFGRAITTPPSTPHFIIRPDGTFTELATGIEPADQLVAQLAAAQG